MSKNQNEQIEVIKIILLGESGVGKTCLINAYFGRKFKENSKPTIASESEGKFFEIKQKKYLIQMVDTAGQERYHSLNKLFIKGSKIVIFIYDVTNEVSFNGLNFWVNTAKEILGKEAIYGIAGNKADLIDETKTSNGDGKKYAEDNDALFCQTSAKEDSKGFQMFVDNMIEKYIEDKNDKVSNETNGRKLSSINNKKGRNCCYNKEV